MKIKYVFGALLILILLAYIYTIILVHGNTEGIIKNDMQLLSGILYSTNVILLDVEQNIEEKYADVLYQAAIIAIRSPELLKETDIDVGFVKESGRVKVILGSRYVGTLKECVDTITSMPRALLCRGFYIYMYPSGKKAAIVAIKKSRVDREKTNIGLDRLFNELSKMGVFFYIALQNDNRVVYSTIDSYLFESFDEDTVLRSVYINGQEIVRKKHFLDRDIIETILPFSYGSFRGVMRIGIDAEKYDSLKSKVYTEVTLLFFVLLIVLLFLYSFVIRVEKAEMGYAALKEVLSTATIPIFMRKGGKIYPLTHKAESMKLPNRQLEDGEVLTIDDTRYMVKGFGNKKEEYFIFLSLEVEDMKKRLMEYEALSNLIAEVAHEIKNPLNGISLLVQSLASEDEKEEYKDILKQVSKIEESINRFVSLLAPLRLRKECISQREIVEEALKETEIDKVRNVVIHGDVHVLCDRVKIKEAYINLLKNAYEATNEGDTIRVKISNESIIFENKGRIEKEDLEHIFDPFYTTKEHGSGIGMYYVRKVVESHGWRIAVRTVNENVEVKIEFNENSRC